MTRINEYCIFLASPQEVAEDRKRFAELLRRRNDDWVGRSVHLRLVVWEDFIDAMSQTRRHLRVLPVQSGFVYPALKWLAEPQPSVLPAL